MTRKHSRQFSIFPEVDVQATDLIMQQDNYPKHSSKSTTKWLKKKIISVAKVQSKCKALPD